MDSGLVIMTNVPDGSTCALLYLKSLSLGEGGKHVSKTRSGLQLEYYSTCLVWTYVL